MAICLQKITVALDVDANALFGMREVIESGERSKILFLEAEFDTEGVLAKADKIMKLARELEEEAHNLRYKAMDIKASEASREKDALE